MTVVFENSDLLPEAWRAAAAGQVVRAFNPGLIRHGNEWLMAYRVVVEPALDRRIALCRLDQGFRVIPGSPQPLSDGITFSPQTDYAAPAKTWFADPRLYRFQGRLFVYWNSGWHEPQNYQFLQELDAATLRPLGPPRELTLSGARQKLEKNWALFELDDRSYAVYSVNPHRVLTFSLAGDGPIVFADASLPVPNPGGYAQVHGGLRGGAPPQQLGSHFYSFCHSIENDPNGYRYVAAVYRFAAQPPFLPTDMPRRPLPIDIPATAHRRFPKLNPAIGNVTYPAGAAYADGKWVISFGIDDERCAVSALDQRTILETLQL